MNKTVVGLYSSTFETLIAIDSLIKKGTDKKDIFVIAQDDYDRRFIEEKSGVTVDESIDQEEVKISFWKRVSSLFSKKEEPTSPYYNYFLKIGVPEDEALDYATQLESGKILVLLDRNEEERPVI